MVQNSDDAPDTSASVSKGRPQFETFDLANDPTKDSQTYSSLSEKIYSESETRLSSSPKTRPDSLPSEMSSAEDLLDFGDSGNSDEKLAPAKAETAQTTPESGTNTKNTKLDPATLDFTPLLSDSGTDGKNAALEPAKLEFTPLASDSGNDQKKLEEKLPSLQANDEMKETPGASRSRGALDSDTTPDDPERRTDSGADGDEDNDEFFAPEEGDEQADAKVKTNREKLQESLEKRNAPYRQEIDDLKKTIEKNDGYKKVWDQVNLFHGMTSVDIKDDKGGNLRLSNTPHGDIFVVQKGDDTYVINRNEPLLDTKAGAADPKGGKIDWSLDRPLKRQAEQQYHHATLSLNQQGNENRRTSTKEIGLKQMAGVQSIADQAHNQGLISDREYADQTGFTGFSYGTYFGDHGTAARLKEKALSISEKALGPTHPDTMDNRGYLAQTYIDSGRTAQANTLLNKQIESIEAREKAGHSLDHETFLQRHTLQNQLERVGRTEDAGKVADRAYDLVIENPDNLPPHDRGLSSQRDDLLKRYLKESTPRRDRIDKLLDLKVDGVKSLSAHEPGSSILEGERRDLIGQLKTFGGDNKARLSGVLQDEEREINKIAGKGFADEMEDRRKQLAQDYLTAGEKDRASIVAAEVIKHHETKEGKPGQQRDDIQKRLNLSSNLAGLAETPLMANFLQKSKAQLETYEKSEDGKKNENAVSSMRREMIEQFTEGKDYKTALSLADRELAHLNERKVPESDQYDVKLTKGELHEKLRDDKTAQSIYEELITRSNNDREKITPLERLSSLYERTKQTDLAKKAKQDLEAIKKDQPPQHFKTGAGVAGS